MIGKGTTGPTNVMGIRLWVGCQPQYVTSHKGQLSLAIHAWLGPMSNSERQ